MENHAYNFGKNLLKCYNFFGEELIPLHAPTHSALPKPFALNSYRDEIIAGIKDFVGENVSADLFDFDGGDAYRSCAVAPRVYRHLFELIEDLHKKGQVSDGEKIAANRALTTAVVENIEAIIAIAGNPDDYRGLGRHRMELWFQTLGHDPVTSEEMKPRINGVYSQFWQTVLQRATEKGAGIGIDQERLPLVASLMPSPPAKEIFQILDKLEQAQNPYDETRAALDLNITKAIRIFLKAKTGQNLAEDKQWMLDFISCEGMEKNPFLTDQMPKLFSLVSRESPNPDSDLVNMRNKFEELIAANPFLACLASYQLAAIEEMTVYSGSEHDRQELIRLATTGYAVAQRRSPSKGADILLMVKAGDILQRNEQDIPQTLKDVMELYGQAARQTRTAVLGR